MAYKFTIIIPIFNEQENLIRLEKELLAYITSSKITTQILLINDGSSDNSLELIRHICNKNSYFSYLSFDKNYGLSTALKAGFDHVNTELVGYMDADLQTSPKDFDRLLEHIDGFDLINGYRLKRNDSFNKRLISKIANRVRRLFTNDGMLDTGCPLKVIKTSYAKRIPMFKGMHRFLPALVLLQNGKITEIPVAHFPRLKGKSKFGFADRLFGPLADCFVYLWMRKKVIHYNIVEQSIER